jgi:hypothetical protein
MAGMTPEAVYNYLNGMRYPARKQELIEHAKNNSAGPDVIEALKTLPDKEFKSQDDLIRVGSQMRHER